MGREFEFEPGAQITYIEYYTFSYIRGEGGDNGIVLVSTRTRKRKEEKGEKEKEMEMGATRKKGPILGEDGILARHEGRIPTSALYLKLGSLRATTPVCR
jgi:hypothetical protein